MLGVVQLPFWQRFNCPVGNDSTALLISKKLPYYISKYTVGEFRKIFHLAYFLATVRLDLLIGSNQKNERVYLVRSTDAQKRDATRVLSVRRVMFAALVACALVFGGALLPAVPGGFGGCGDFGGVERNGGCRVFDGCWGFGKFRGFGKFSGCRNFGGCGKFGSFRNFGRFRGFRR